MTCPSATARTGALGKAVADDTLIARITQWTLNVAIGETAWGDSDSGGFTARKGARRDGTGSVNGKFDTANKAYDLFMPGDTPKFVLWESTEDYWAFPCVLIQKFSVTYNQDTKEVVQWSADFGADGRFYYPGEAGAPVESLPT